MRKSGRRRWQRSQRILGFVRKISETRSYCGIDSAYHSASLMQQCGTAGRLPFLIPPHFPPADFRKLALSGDLEYRPWQTYIVVDPISATIQDYLGVQGMFTKSKTVSK
jgi:hypothetical protein